MSMAKMESPCQRMRYRLDGEVDNDLGVTRMVDATMVHPIIDSQQIGSIPPRCLQTRLADEGKGGLADSTTRCCLTAGHTYLAWLRMKAAVHNIGQRRNLDIFSDHLDTSWVDSTFVSPYS
jgi:hypothetical protein